MRVAIQLYGQPRYITESYEYGWKDIIKKYNADVYIHTWFDIKSEINTIPHYLMDEMKVSDDVTKNTIKNIVELYNPVAFRYDTPPNFEEIMHQFTSPTERIEQAIYGQHLSAYYVNKLRVESKYHYDVILKSRLDMIITKPNIDIPEENTVKVPYIFNSVMMNPIMDHWAIGTPDTISKYCNVIKNINYFISKGCTLQSEFLVHLHLIREKIKIERIPYDSLITREYIKNGGRYDFNNLQHIDHYDITGESLKQMKKLNQ